nr:DoxX family membrane protein [Mucilaginibacter sp. MD40]
MLKGCAFLVNLNYLEKLLAGQELAALSTTLINVIMCYVVLVHLSGGALVILGLYTRLASLFQLPVVIAALFILKDLRSPFNSDFWVSVVAALLLILFAIIGSGKFSADEYLATMKQDMVSDQ